jgi:hypothetical protein
MAHIPHMGGKQAIAKILNIIVNQFKGELNEKV